MKTLILSDEVYGIVRAALATNQRGREALEILDAGPPPLPSDRELVMLSRQKAEAPLAFQRARAYRDAGRQAAEDTRLALNDLIVHAYDAGVSPRVLSRWSGLKEARLFEIINSARAAA